MTVISKELFYEKVSKDIPCKIVHYWQPNCALSVLEVIKNVIFGTAGFYVPIYLAQTALRYKRFNLKKTLKAYIRSWFYGLLYGTFFMSSFCIFAKIFGRIHYYCVGFGPGICSACSIFAESNEMLNLNTLIYTTLVVETALKTLEMKGFWNGSVRNQTMLFMVCSAFLMLLMSKRKSKTFTHFWFFSPPQIKCGKENEVCDHKETCSKFCLKGTFRYFLIGYTINFAKELFGKLKRSPFNIKNLLNLIFNRNNVLFATFFGAYVGIFRSVTCLLSKKYKKKKNWHTLVAGFLSGITYAIKPNLQMICIAMVTMFQLLSQNYLNKEMVETFRLREILFILSAGVLTHILIANHDLCPKYFVNVVNTCTRGIILKAYRRMLETVLAS